MSYGSLSKIEELDLLPRDPNGYTYNHESIDGVRTLIARGTVGRESLFERKLHYFCEIPEKVDTPLPSDLRIFIRGNVDLWKCRSDFPLHPYNWYILWRCSLQIDDEFIKTKWVTTDTEYPNPDEKVDPEHPKDPVLCEDDLRIWGIRDGSDEDSAQFWLDTVDKMEKKIIMLIGRCFPIVENDDPEATLTRGYSDEILTQINKEESKQQREPIYPKTRR